MSGGPLRLHRDRCVDVLVLDSPATRNALSLRLLGELADAVSTSAGGDARALVLTHSGPAFCAGLDLKERRSLDPADDRHSALLTGLLRALWAYPKPVLCCVDGAVRGGGMGLLACADIAVCSAASSFAYSEVRVGVAPALVSVLTLAKVAPAGPLPWLLTGAGFGAETARTIGLVARVADAGAAPSVEAELDGIRRSAPGAVARMKAIARELCAVDVDAALTRLQQVSGELFAGAEAHEGMAAFAEHRAPNWSLLD